MLEVSGKHRRNAAQNGNHVLFRLDTPRHTDSGGGSNDAYGIHYSRETRVRDGVREGVLCQLPAA